MAKELLQEDIYRRSGPYHRAALHRFPRQADIRYHVTNKLLPKDLTGQHCLDFGGGDGTMASFMANRGADVVVFDPSRTALDYAVSSDKRLKAVQGRTQLPFRDRQFRIVTMLETLEHIPDEQEALALGEAARVLDDNGLLVLSVPSMNLRIGSRHYRHYSLADLTRKIENAGFATSRTVPYRNLVDGLQNLAILRKPVKGFIYGLDYVVRSINGNMGLVECDESQAAGFIVLASKKN